MTPPLRILFAAALILPTASWGVIDRNRLFGIDLGGAITASYNNAWSQTTSTDWRLGFGLGAQFNFRLNNMLASVLLGVTKSQLLSQRIDGAKSESICNESYFPGILQMPGPCSMIQVRFSPIYWIQNIGFGISLVYNYLSDITFYGAEIYNTRRSYEALGPVIAFRQSWQRFTLQVAAHFDYAVFSQSPLANQSVQSLQAGVTLYAMYAVY
ncbi:MAG: hypothetical protein J0L53_07930 [Spirochaetes bacterium]|nr:hypothetical protein [Spirochaetota bacterium]